MLKEIIVKSGNINFCVNPFLECLGVAFLLNNFSLNKPRTNLRYIEKCKNFFNKYNEHNFVVKIKKLIEKPSFKYDAPVEMALAMFHKKRPSKTLLERAGLNLKEYKELYNDLTSFINETNFNAFFFENKFYYTAKIEEFIKDINEYSPHNYLFNFLGLKSKNLNIVLMFSVTTSNYGISLNKNLYCCVRPYKESRYSSEIDFCYDLPYMTTLILHEFAHSFINPITDRYENIVNSIDDKLFSLAFQNNPYGESKVTVINESIIRAIECRYLKDNFPSSYNEIKKDYINDGFILIPKLEEVFEKYSNNRNKYKNIKKFYVEIINEIKQYNNVKEV